MLPMWITEPNWPWASPYKLTETLSNSLEVISNSLTKGTSTNGMPNTLATTSRVTLTTIPKRLDFR